MGSKTKRMVVICPEHLLERHLRRCRNSEYTVQVDRDLSTVQVDDHGQRVLHGFGFNGHWLLSLHPRYYDHPLAESRSRPQ